MPTMWMNREDIMLSEVSQTEKPLLHDLTYMWNLKQPNSFKKSDWWLPEVGG